MLAAHSKPTAGHEEFDQKGFAKVTFNCCIYNTPALPVSLRGHLRVEFGVLSPWAGECMMTIKKREDQMVANRFGEEGKKEKPPGDENI